MTPLDVANKARELEGVKFRKYGRELKHGIDCIGVPIWVGQQLGLIGSVHIPPYTFPPEPALFDELLPRFVDEIEAVEVGAIIILNGEKSGRPQHCAIIVPAIYTGNLHCIGAMMMPSRAFIGEFKLSAATLSRLHKVYRYRGLAS